METLLIVFLKTGFLKISESLPFLNINLKWRANFKFIGFLWYATLIGWILYTLSEYNYKIRLVSILRKRDDQGSTILKF